MPFCGQCGSLVGAGNCCDKCGARLAHAPATAATPPVQPAAQPPLPSAPTPQPAAQPAAQGSNSLTKYLVGCLVFILLIVLAALGSCAYIGYPAKKKTDEISQAYKSNDLNKLAGALGAGSSKPGGQGSGGSSSSSTSAPLSFPAWTPSSQAEKSSGSVTGSRTVRTEDLRSAHDYMQWFGPNQPEVM